MKSTPPAPVPTPQAAQRNVPGATSGTRAAKLERLPSRTPTHAVQGPPTTGTGKPVSANRGAPPLHGTPAAATKPKEQR